MNPLTGLSAGMLAGGVIIGYMAGNLTVDFNANQEINRLKGEVTKRDETINIERQAVENHKQFIRTKDTLARRFCDQYFKGDKK